MMQILSYIGVGLATGVLSGLLGVGGGVILVPALVFIFSLTMKNAIGTSLAIIIPTAIVGTYFHYREGNVNFSLVIYIAIAAIIGSRIGVYLNDVLPNIILRRMFGALLLLIGIKMIIGK
mgnify:FL=1